MQFIGHAGLALATSISAAVQFFILLYFLKKKFGKFKLENMKSTLIKILFLTLIIWIVLTLVSNLFPQESMLFSILRISILGSLSAVILFGGAHILNIENSKVIGRRLWKKLTKK